MRFTAIATDFDGTIACEGVVAAETAAALKRAKSAGLRLMLVTGRELPSLFNTFSGSAVFDVVIAENGAVSYRPDSGTIERLAAAPPPALVERLTRENVPISVGHSIVATLQPYAAQLHGAIRALDLAWNVIPNKDALMALPVGVTKASGLIHALECLALDARQTVGIGDAENDHALLQVCGLAVAVHNALPSLKRRADVVTTEESGAGVVELIEQLLAGQLDRFAAPETVARSCTRHQR